LSVCLCLCLLFCYSAAAFTTVAGRLHTTATNACQALLATSKNQGDDQAFRSRCMLAFCYIVQRYDMGERMGGFCMLYVLCMLPFPVPLTSLHAALCKFMVSTCRQYILVQHWVVASTAKPSQPKRDVRRDHFGSRCTNHSVLVAVEPGCS
jgi:hypothetical protein